MATASAPAQPNAAQALALSMKYGPNSGLAFQRSQYLADALQSLQKSASENISTPTALWSNLLADGILQWGKHRADKNAMTAYQADLASQDKSLFAGTPLDASAAPAAPSGPADPSASAPAVAAPPPAQPIASASLPPAGPTPAGPALAAALEGGGGAKPPPSPQDLDAVTRMIIGEAGGEGPTGEAAAGAVAYNRLAKGFGGAHSLHDVVTQPHQFEGITSPRATGASPDSPQYQQAMQIAQGLASGGVTDPTGGAVNFINPDLQVAEGRNIPGWAQGQGQRIGHHVFFGGSPGGGAPGPQQASAGAPPPPAPSPNGPPVRDMANLAMGAQLFPASPATPSPAGAAPPPALSSPGLQAGGAGPQAAPAAQPHNVVTPQEWQTAAGLLHDPRTRDLGVQELLKLKMRAAGALEAPKNMMWDQASGRFVPMPGTATTQLQGLSPSDAPQRDMMGNITHGTIPGVQGSVPEGMVRNPQTGAYERVTTQQAQTFRIPNVSGVFVTGPDGKPVKVGEDQYGPSELLKMRDNLLGAEPVKLYQQAADAYGSMVAAAKQNPGGMRAYALRDTFARAINPGAVARVGTIQAIRESQGLPAEIKGFFMNLRGDGNVPPEIAQQILDVTQGFVASHYHGAQQLVQSNADYAKRHQIDPADVTVPIGDAPQRFVIAPPKAAPPPQASAQAAIMAEIQRRKAAGTWTGH